MLMNQILRQIGALRFAFGYIVIAAMVSTVIEWFEAYYFEQGEPLYIWHLVDAFILISITGIALYFLLQTLLSEDRRSRSRHKNSQKIFQQLFWAHTQPMFLYNPANRHILDANNAAVSRYGWSREEFMRMRADDVQYSSADGSMDDYFSNLPDNTKHQFLGGQRHVDRSGAPFWSEVTTHPLHVRDSLLQFVTCVDINLQVEAARKARKAIKHLEDAEELGSFGAWEWHPGQTTMRVSRGLARLYGLPEGQNEMSLRSAFERILPEDRPRTRMAAEECLLTGQGKAQFRARLFNGDIRHFREILHTQPGNSSEFIMTGSVIDETDQLRYTRTLERQESDLRKTLTNLPAPVVLLEPGGGGQIHLANPAFYRMLGIPAGAEPSVGEFCQIGAGPENQSLLETLVGPNGPEIAGTWKPEVLLEKADGSVFRVEIHSTYLDLSERKLLQLVIHDVEKEIALRDQLERANQSLSELNRETLRILEQERAQIARELHDDIGQLLIAVKTNLHSLHQKWPRGAEKPPESDLISEILQELIAKVRDRSLLLRPPELDELGLKHAITQEMRRVTGPTEILAELNGNACPEKMPDESVLTAFRIFQEAMANAVRHGNPTRLRVTLGCDNSHFTICIEDNGTGFDPESPKKGLGLLNMKERASLASGELAIASSPTRGTRICARLPLKPREQSETLKETDQDHGRSNITDSR